MVSPYGGFNMYQTRGYGDSGSGGLSDDAEAARWDQYTEDLGEALQQSSGFEREKLAAQLKDAEAGRANAYKIAQLSASTQRYGIDKNFEAAMKELKEKQREFDLSHDLEMRKFGLDQQRFGVQYAQAATEYLSTPDRYAQGMDFRMMADRFDRGLRPQPYGTGVTFQPKTPEDFAALASYGQPSSSAGSANAGWMPPRTGQTEPFQGAAPSQSAPAGGLTSAPSGGFHESGDYTPGASVANNEGPGQQQAPDPRVKVMKSMLDAIPPSQGSGMDENDFAVMRAAQALYSTNLKPGTLQAMRPGQKAILSSFVKRSGRDWNDFQDDYYNYQPNQQSVRRYA